MNWDAVYARVASATGWTWEYIGQALTLPRLYALWEYWQGSPPVAESVAAYLGVKPERKSAPATPEKMQETIAEIRRLQRPWPTTTPPR